MKRSIMRLAIGILGVGMMASVTTGCLGTVPIPPDQLARIEAATNKAEAAANQAAASAKSASDSAARAQAAVAKIESGFTGKLHK